MKKCLICYKEKSIGEFNKNSRNKDGLNSYCRKCHKEKYDDPNRLHNKLKNKDKNPYDGTDKTCSTCRELLSRTKQYWLHDLSHYDGLRSQCSDCEIIDHLKRRTKERHGLLNLPPNFTGKQARELKARQNYCCYVCGEKENGKRLHLDHDHKTGNIRGYACLDCNTGFLRGVDRILRLERNEGISEVAKSVSILFKNLSNFPASYLYAPLDKKEIV